VRESLHEYDFRAAKAPSFRRSQSEPVRPVDQGRFHPVGGSHLDITVPAFIARAVDERRHSQLILREPRRGDHPRRRTRLPAYASPNCAAERGSAPAPSAYRSF